MKGGNSSIGFEWKLPNTDGTELLRLKKIYLLSVSCCLFSLTYLGLELVVAGMQASLLATW